MTTKNAKPPSKRIRESLIVPTQRDVAHFFDVSRTTVQSWVADGLPRLSDGRYCLGECVRWKEKRDAKREQREGRSPEELAHQRRLLEAKVRLREAEAAGKERRVKELSESTLPRDECQYALDLLRQAIKNRFDRIPKEVSLPGVDPKLEKTIREELRHQVELVLIEAGDFRLPEPIRK